MKLTQGLLVVGFAAAALAAGIAGKGSAQSELPKVHLKIVGSFGTLRQYDLIEKPYFTKVIPERSKGRITTDLVSTEELGLKGFEMVRLMKQGLLDIGTPNTQYVGGDEPFVEGIDLGGLYDSVEKAHKAHVAYKGPLDQRFQKKFNVKVLTVWPYAAQIVFCRVPISGLADLKGKKVRVAGRNIGEFVEYVGGTAVSMSFAESYDALSRGVVDCAVSSALSGNSARWYEMTTHLYTLPVGWASAMHVVSLKTWSRMDGSTRTFLSGIFDEMEQKLWEFGSESHEDGLNCNSGKDPCKYGYKGKMTLVTPSAADLALRDEALRKSVLPKWVKRCGADCVRSWNETIGKIVGLQAGSE